jgi:hypothetical protein
MANGGSIPSLDVNREAVRTLVIAIGVRAAARQLGLNEDTVSAWSARGKWLQLPKPATQFQPASNASIAPADALANILQEQGRTTKLNLSKAAGKAADRFQEMPADKVIEKSGRLLDITKVASTIHGWDQSQSSSALNLNVLSGGRAIVQVNAKDQANENSE